MHYNLLRENIFRIDPSLVRRPLSLSPKSLKDPRKIYSLHNYAALCSYVPSQTCVQKREISKETYDSSEEYSENREHWGVIPQSIDFSGDEWLERSSD